MRLWSLHPKYLDTKGLLAVWREALLAKKVLQMKTKGYKKHPQLNRFKNNTHSINSINIYLNEILNESRKRNFNFDAKKVGSFKKFNTINVSSGQVKFEFEHLLNKLKERDIVKYKQLKNIKMIETHPLFKKSPGKVENWEKY